MKKIEMIFFLINYSVINLITLNKGIELEVYRIILLYLYIYILASYIFIRKKIVTPYTIFLLTFLVFNLSRIFLYYLNNSIDYGYANMFVNYEFSYQIKEKIIKLIIFSLLNIHFGILISESIILKLNKKQKDKKKQKNKRKIQKFAYVISILTLQFALINLFLKISNTIIYGYVVGRLKEVPLILRILSTAYIPSTILFISTRPDLNKNKNKLLIIILGSYLLLILLTGNRGEALTSFLAFLTLITIIYDIKVNMFSLLKIGTLLIFLSQLSFYYRLRQTIKLNIIDAMVNFLYEQGVSILVLGFTIEKKINYGILSLIEPLNIMYFDYWYKLIFRINQYTYLQLAEKKILSANLSYILNSEAYFNGYGIGSNFIAELYTINGLLSVVIGSFSLGLIINFIFNRFSKTPFGLFFCYFFLKGLYFMPRGSLVLFLGSFFKEYIIIYILYIIYNALLIISKNRKKE